MITNNLYRIEYCAGEIKYAGWRVYRASWQSHRSGKPCKNSRPRWKMVCVKPTQQEARDYIRFQEEAG